MRNLTLLANVSIAVIILILAFGGKTAAGILNGTVINDFNYEPVPDVEVTVFQVDSTLAGIDTTDTDGTYSLTLNIGSHYAIYTKQNYADTTISDIPITPDTITIDLTLRFLQNCIYVAGDVNNDGVFNGFDMTYLYAWLKGGPPPPYSCECTPGRIWWVALEANGSCNFNGLDITFLLGHFPNGVIEIMPCPDCPPVE